MAERALDRARLSTRSAVPLARRVVFPASQVIALLVAIYLGRHGYEMVRDDRFAIDRAAAWYAVALFLLAYFAWNGAPPDVRRWPAAVVSYVRAHPVELVLLAGITALGALVRLYRFGELPPHGYIILEEHINGGISWNILQGDRPYIYPAARYAGALSLDIFGGTTTGLRAHSVTAGIVSVPFFYLMMREVVSRPAALFATGVFASLRVLGDTTTHFQSPMLVTIVMVWLGLRALRTGNLVWLVPAGFLAAVVSYEYEVWKAVPIFAAMFLIFFVVRGLVLPASRDWRAYAERARTHAPAVARAAIVMSVAVLIGLGPMLADRERDVHIYINSLERQKADRDARGTPGLFAENAGEQLKWTVQAYTPWVDADYPRINPADVGGIIDRWSSALLWVSVVAAAVMFWRGSRALFVGWFVGGLLGASLLLSNWAGWKVVGFLPPAVALTGFLADDALQLASRHRRWTIRVITAMVVIVAVIAVASLRQTDKNADNDAILREYANTPSQLFSVCDNLNDRPDGTFGVVSQRIKARTGFTEPPANDTTEEEAWGDFRFACWGLRGRSVPDLQEAWPGFVDGDGPVSLVMVGRQPEIDRTIDALRGALPEIGEPSEVAVAPAGAFTTLVYDTDAAAMNARRGLVARIDGADGESEERIIAAPELVLGDAPAGGGSAVISGLVYLPAAADASLRGEGVRDAVVTVDGQPSYDATASPAATTPRRLMAGWHFVEVRANFDDGAKLRLDWLVGDTPLAPLSDHYFALRDTNVWAHTRTFTNANVGVAAIPEAQRFDFAPHYAFLDGIRPDGVHALPPGTRIEEDRWSTVWTVDAAGLYTISVDSPGGGFRFMIDGREVKSSEGPLDQWFEPFEIAAGDHRLEIVFEGSPQPFVGGLFRVIDASGADVDMKLRPF